MSLKRNGCPCVSCVLPVFNCERYLEEAIESILGQTYPNFELIVIDDGSTDRSGSISDEFAAKEPRIRVIHQKNAGIAAALNAGIALASGEYIARMDGDDVALPTRFERQVDVLEENPAIVLLGCVCHTIDAQGNMWEPALSKSEPLTIAEAQLDSFPPLIHQVCHPSVMVRTAAVRQIGGYKSAYDYAEDYDLYLRIAALGAIGELNEPLLLYRKHASSICGQHWREQVGIVARSEIANTNARRRASGQCELVISDLTFESYVAVRAFRNARWEGRIEPGVLIKATVLALAGALRSDFAVTSAIVLEIARNISATVRHTP
jgi:Glycosyltransferases involved in cell wall biogenesis